MCCQCCDFWKMWNLMWPGRSLAERTLEMMIWVGFNSTNAIFWIVWRFSRVRCWYWDMTCFCTVDGGFNLLLQQHWRADSGINKLLIRSTALNVYENNDPVMVWKCMENMEIKHLLHGVASSLFDWNPSYFHLVQFGWTILISEVLISLLLGNGRDWSSGIWTAGKKVVVSNLFFGFNEQIALETKEVSPTNEA